MGISPGRIALVNVSADNKSIAPDNIETGISLRLSGPVRNLTMWGTRSPTNPIIPDTETQIAVTMDAVTRRIRVTLFVCTPREEAVRLPREIRLRSRAKNIIIKNPPHKNNNVIITSAHVFETKLPISQKMIIETCSSATYFKKLIPADKMAATIIPERIRLFEEKPPLADERYTTKNRVPIAPMKAKAGTEQAPRKILSKRTILKKNARQAPKAAPADTPSVYGSASGFNKIPWKAAPATASPAPTIAAVSIRGKRTSITTTERISSISLRRPVCPDILAKIIFATSRNDK